VSPRDLEPYRFAGPACNLLVFVNGKHAPKLSTSRSLAKGLKVSSLTEAMKSDKSFVEQHLAKYVDYHRDAFSALNTAFMTDGAFVSIPKGTILDEPIYLLYVSTASSAPTISHPRNLIIVGEDCQAAIVEDYVSLSDDAQFSNVVTELIVGDNSVVSHHLIERENDHSFNVSTLRIQQGRSSNVSSHSLLVGGAIVRNNIHPVLAGEGGDCLINGLFMANGRQHMDNYMKVEHASPHCGSRQFYNGILDGKSHGVFHGRIIVHKNAQKTDAKQTNRNLLLSDSAQIDTKPQLEIYADDVKCTHGATIGQIDDEAIFYLRSRGITVDSARALLLSAFAGESLQRIKVDSIRQHAEALVAQWLPQINILEKLT
jgi:Fe-S cluster assembly protein SufD